MQQYQDIFAEPGNQNWFKACLALRVTKTGLNNFISNEIQQFHRLALTDVLNAEGLPHGSVCGRCNTNNVVPCPTVSICSVKSSKHCKYHSTAAKQFISCPSKLCHGVRNKIKGCHRFNSPSWKNTKAEEWYSNPWQLAKCYMPPDGYEGAQTINETDFNGLINLLINCKWFGRKFSFKVSGSGNPLSQARDFGRLVRHTSNLCLSDEDLKKHFSALMTLLSDQKHLLLDRNAHHAMLQLQQLMNNELHISTGDIAHVLEDALGLIDEHRDQGIKDIDKKLEDVIKTVNTQLSIDTVSAYQLVQSVGKVERKNIELAGSSVKMEVKHAKKCALKQIGHVCQEVNININNSVHAGMRVIQSTASDLQNDIRSERTSAIEEIRKTEHSAMGTLLEVGTDIFRDLRNAKDTSIKGDNADSLEEPTDYEQSCRELQHYLLDLYRSMYLNIDMTSDLPNRTCSVADVYVPLPFEQQFPNATSTTIHTFKEMLIKDGQPANIGILISEAGMGKSVFSQNVLSTWCNLWSEEIPQSNSPEDDAHTDCLSPEHQRGDSQSFIQDTSEWTGLPSATHCIPTKEESQWLRTSQANMGFMKSFPFAFCLSAGMMSENISIEEMLWSQLFQNHPQYLYTFSAVMEREPSVCLFVIDDIDELSDVSRLTEFMRLTKRSKTLCTARIMPALTAVSVSEIRFKEIDRSFKVRMVERYLQILYPYQNVTELCDQFIEDLEMYFPGELQSSPMMIRLALERWIFTKQVPKTVTETCNEIVKSHSYECMIYTERDAQPIGTYKMKQNHSAQHMESMDPNLCELSKLIFESFVQSGSSECNISTLKLNEFGQDNHASLVAKGFVSKQLVPVQLADNYRIRLCHKSFYDYFMAMHVIQNESYVSQFLEECKTHEHVRNMTTLISLLCGLNPACIDDIFSTIYEKVSISNDNENYKLIQEVFTGCLREISSRLVLEICIPLKSLNLNSVDDCHLLKYIDPTKLKTLTINDRVVELLLSKQNMGYIDALAGLEALHISRCMTENEFDCSKAHWSFLCTENIRPQLQKVSFRNYKDIVNDHWSMLNFDAIKEIQVFDGKFTHTEVTNLLCKLQMLHTVVFENVQCVSDRNCFCGKVIEDYASPDDYLSDLRASYRTISNVKVCNIASSPQALYHVLGAPSLKYLNYKSCHQADDDRVFSLLKTCSAIQHFSAEAKVQQIQDVKFSETITELRMVKLTGTYNGNALRSLTESVPIDHPTVLFDLDVHLTDITPNELSHYFKQRLNSEIEMWLTPDKINVQAFVLINNHRQHMPRLCQMNKQPNCLPFDIIEHGTGVLISGTVGDDALEFNRCVEIGDNILSVNRRDVRLVTQTIGKRILTDVDTPMELLLQFSPKDYISASKTNEHNLSRYRWWKGDMTRKDAEVLLRLHSVDGHFLLRNTEANYDDGLACRLGETPCTHPVGKLSEQSIVIGTEHVDSKAKTLSMCKSGRMFHYKILINGDGRYYISMEKTLESLADLVSYYTNYASGLPCTLGETPCTSVVLGENVRNTRFGTQHVDSQKKLFKPTQTSKPNEDNLSRYRWWKGDMSRKHAESVLRLHSVDGNFLLRNTSDGKAKTLSMYKSGQVVHYILGINRDGRYYISEDETFKCLGDLVRHYTTYAGGLPCTLESPYETIPKKCDVGLLELSEQSIVLGENIGNGHFGQVYAGMFCFHVLTYGHLQPTGIAIITPCLVRAYPNIRPLAVLDNKSEVAVKKVKREKDEWYTQEVLFQGRLKHSNILEVIGVCRRNMELWIITELMAHGSLLHFLRKHNDVSLHITKRINFAEQIASGMMYLAEHRVAHCDLRADNILLATENTIKISDFSLAVDMTNSSFCTTKGLPYRNYLKI